MLNDLLADVSIQRYVLQRALGEKFSGKCYIAYLNKEYIRDGAIDPMGLIQQEFVTSELRPDSEVERVLEVMRQALPMNHDQFSAAYPYDGTDHMTYFGKSAPKRSIRSISRLGAEQKAKLRNIGITDLEKMEEEHMELLKNAKGEETA